ncbi:hypothetical protein NQZ68_038473 [Dissostichus eleginoides]|nr:hypothetical protein NQZ68_038473 [Dissostichus eleginoides]
MGLWLFNVFVEGVQYKKLCILYASPCLIRTLEWIKSIGGEGVQSVSNFLNQLGSDGVLRSDAGRHRTDEEEMSRVSSIHEGVSIDLKDIQKVRHHNRSTRNLQRTFEPANLQDGNH